MGKWGDNQRAPQHIAADDPASCTICRRDHGLLESPSWKRFRSLAKREQKLLRALNQAKLRSHRTAPRRKFRHEIPCNNDYDHAVDRGANGGAAGNDVRVIEKHPDKTCNIKGIDNHEVPSMPIATAGGVASTISGEVALIMHQYAYHPKCATIHSSAQIEHYKNVVDDRSIKVGGGQHITTLDGYEIPMSIRSALPYAPLRPCTDAEWETLPHVILTSDADWDPASLDCEGEIANDIWFDAQSSFPEGPQDKNFDEAGTYRHLNSQEMHYLDAETYAEPNLDDVMQTFVECDNITTKTNEPQYELMCPLFNWMPLNVIKKTFQLSSSVVEPLHQL